MRFPFPGKKKNENPGIYDSIGLQVLRSLTSLSSSTQHSEFFYHCLWNYFQGFSHTLRKKEGILSLCYLIAEIKITAQKRSPFSVVGMQVFVLVYYLYIPMDLKYQK